MKRYALLILSLLCVVSTAWAGTPNAQAPTIEGNYVEVRSCDVYTGYCFVNAELGLTGEEAILTWDITKGSWDNVDLSGLQVIAVIRASATLGDRDHDALPAKSVVILDRDASDRQREALLSFVREMAGPLVNDIVRVDTLDIDVAMDSCTEEVCATVKAGDTVNIVTRCIDSGDKVCGNEEAYFAPLTDVQNARVHFTERDRFAGKGLGVTWDGSGRRSAYLATFSR
ncbi:MAG: DUF1326 domain-containing protein [Candidatus Hydrogenedentes bacterium]|nr:DUF1326 domain-containing protein [Candidatus Hydrogenedentota bacterium]